MLLEVRERQLQVIARWGLKIVVDRYSTNATGQRSYFLRPIWDARRAVRLLPDEAHELVTITAGRRQAATLLTLDGVEHVLKDWNEPETFASARLPWQSGVVAEKFLR